MPLPLRKAPPDGKGALQPEPVRGLREGKEEAAKEDQGRPQGQGKAVPGEEGEGQEEGPRLEEPQGSQEPSQAQAHAGGAKGLHGRT